VRGAESNVRPYRDRPERHLRAKMVVVETHLKGSRESQSLPSYLKETFTFVR
jgi:hypothetical protein